MKTVVDVVLAATFVAGLIALISSGFESALGWGLLALSMGVELLTRRFVNAR